ncbi:hypothetical protein ACHWQZ_G016707 [Mnemiopsis leidyi]
MGRSKSKKVYSTSEDIQICDAVNTFAGDFDQMGTIQEVSTENCGGFSNVGLFSSTGVYSVTLGDGQCVEINESALKQSSRRADKFTCMLNGVKHKLRLNQIQPCVTNYSQSCEVSGDVSGEILRVRSATPGQATGVIDCTADQFQSMSLSTRPSPITFYPYYKIKIGDSVKVLPFHIVSAGKASRRFFRFRYDGKTITVRKSHIRPVTKQYKVILDGRVTDIGCNHIQPYGDNAYLITHNGVERIVGSASVHSGVQDGAELITDDEDGIVKQPLFPSKNRSSAVEEDETTGRRFGLIKRYTKTKRGKRVRKVPRRKKSGRKDLKIYDVSFCLCYQIILNGAHIVIPQHRIKQSKRHAGYLRFRYNKMVYYITPQTITQAFYAPVVGYYSIVIDEKVVVVSGREMEKHAEKEDTYIIRYNNDTYEVNSTAISFLGEYVLEPDREVLTDEGESTAVSSEESDTTDSDASVSGRDEIMEDANIYTTRTFVIRRKTIATCYRIRLNGSELVVPVSQVSNCKTRSGMLRITYYNKTYFISQDDIELQYETEVTGFYSVTINGNPVILTGDDIEDSPSDGTYICYYKNSRYVLAQTQIMYLGDYPVIQAPNYVETEVESSEESDAQTGHGDDDVSEEEPQMCIFVNEKPNMDMTLPEPTQGSVMGWKVYIDGRFYTVPANRLKQLRNAPGFMEIIVNRKLYHVSIENIQPIMLPTVYFITIQNRPILVPAKDVRRHPTEEGFVIVKYRGQDYVIAVGELKLADGSSVNYEDIPMDQEYIITRTTKTTKRIRRKKRRSGDFARSCSPLCDKVRIGSGSDTESHGVNPAGFSAMAQIANGMAPQVPFAYGSSHVVAPGGVVMGQGGFGHAVVGRPSSAAGMAHVGITIDQGYGVGGGSSGVSSSRKVNSGGQVISGGYSSTGGQVISGGHVSGGGHGTSTVTFATGGGSGAIMGSSSGGQSVMMGSSSGGQSVMMGSTSGGQSVMMGGQHTIHGGNQTMVGGQQTIVGGSQSMMIGGHQTITKKSKHRRSSSTSSSSSSN